MTLRNRGEGKVVLSLTQLDRGDLMFKKSLQRGLCLVLAVLMSFASIYDVLAAENMWDEFGIKPFASSFAEACAKAPVAIDGMSLSQEDKDAFKQKLGSDCEGGIEEWITPDMTFKDMWSGGTPPHVIHDFPVARLYVAQSPSGRPYREESVAQAVFAWTWTIQTNEGEKKLVLPKVCFNWSLLIVTQCVAIAFTPPPQGPARVKARWMIGSGSPDLLPPNACSAQRQGTDPWSVWLGQCDVCAVDADFLGFMEEILHRPVWVNHTYLYAVTSEQQALRFPLSVKNDVVRICLEYDDNTATCGVYVRPEDWAGKTTIDISDDMWSVDSGNCPK